MRLSVWVVLVSLIPFVTIQTSVAETTNLAEFSIRQSGGWKVVESRNFRCWSVLPDQEVRQLAQSCEVWRERLRKTWMTHVTPNDWVPKCDVYVHTTRADYNRALNRPGDSSVGSTMMDFDQGRTVLRRIDVRSDASDWSNAALPHELTHVVLGERFGGHALPRWADEGIAMLSESSDKHRERLTNLQEIVAGRPTLTIAELCRTTRIPSAALRDAFYGQSIALASLLIAKSTPAKFADFIEESTAVGLDPALQKHYNLQGVNALQREWNEWIRRPQAMKFTSLPIQVGTFPSVADIEAR